MKTLFLILLVALTTWSHAQLPTKMQVPIMDGLGRKVVMSWTILPGTGDSIKQTAEYAEFLATDGKNFPKDMSRQTDTRPMLQRYLESMILKASLATNFTLEHPKSM